MQISYSGRAARMAAVLKDLSQDDRHGERQKRVGPGYSDDDEAAVQGRQRLKGGLLPRCRPTPINGATAGQAEYGELLFWQVPKWFIARQARRNRRWLRPEPARKRVRR